jgi:hypothetical protein
VAPPEGADVEAAFTMKPSTWPVTAFDHDRLVADAGLRRLRRPATLANHLGLRELVEEHLDQGERPGRSNVGDRLLTMPALADDTRLRSAGLVGGELLKLRAVVGHSLRRVVEVSLKNLHHLSARDISSSRALKGLRPYSFDKLAEGRVEPRVGYPVLARLP